MDEQLWHRQRTSFGGAAEAYERGRPDPLRRALLPLYGDGMKAGPTAATAEEYLDRLPADRADAFRSALALVRSNLPAGLEERINWGMVCWEVPLSVYPKTYNKQPLLVTALANQKNHLSLYLNAVYAMPELRERLTAAAPDLRMGKSCVNFTRYEQLPEAALAEIIGEATPERYIAVVEQVASRRR